jgi:alcohol dehydrogenase (cytochrome c)
VSSGEPGAMQLQPITAVIILSAGIFCFAVDAADISDARLKAAASEPESWLLYGRDYTNQRFSPLGEINTGNVTRLVPKWIYQSGVSATFQASPIVADGVMYVSLPFSHVAALDAATGREIWRYEHKRKTDKLCCGPANRGVSIGYGKVFIGTVDARLIALDQMTGAKLWDVDLGAGGAPTEEIASLDPKDPLAKQAVTGQTGAGMNAAPLVLDGRVIAGITGVGYGLHLQGDRPGLSGVVGISGRYGRPGFMAAFDAETGRKIWQFDTTQPGWEGTFSPATPYGASLPRDVEAEKALATTYPDAWRFGGGSIWHSPAADIERGLIYFGIGNPSPQASGENRPGDNLYTVSLVALEAATGKLVWHYQQVPHDLWGYDVASPPVLFDAVIDGKTVPAVGEASKLGWFFVHDRRDGTLLFKSAPFIPQENMFAAPSQEATRIVPGAAGGANWSPVSLDAKAQRVYVAAMHMPFIYGRKSIPAAEDKPEITYYTMEPAKEPRWGLLSAIGLSNGGRIAWQVKTENPLVGGALATAGGLVFTGDGNGDFSAYEASSGRRLWNFNCGAGVNAPPVTFAVGGKEYIAVAAGGSQIWGYRQGDAVIAFGLAD